MKISIVIPTLNEKVGIVKLIKHIEENSSGLVREIIVVDGGSTDGTAEVLKGTTAIVVENNISRRSSQMNAGSSLAKSEIVYFVHADSLPPRGFDESIVEAVNQGYSSGCFRSVFDSDHLFLRLCSYCTRFPSIICRGGGQTLFVRKEVFEKVGEYDENQAVMEEYDLILRLKKVGSFKIIPENTVVSARKYRKNGTFRLYITYVVIFILFFTGVSQRRLQSLYQKFIH